MVHLRTLISFQFAHNLRDLVRISVVHLLLTFLALPLQVIESVDYGDYTSELDTPKPPGLEWRVREGTRYEYHFSREYKSFIQAHSACLGEYGDLLAIEDAKENEWVHQNRVTGESQWIGLRNGNARGRDDEFWRWTDFRVVKSYTNYGPSEPKLTGDACAAFKGKNDAKWYTYHCDIPRGFICKRKISPCHPSPCAQDKQCIPKGEDDYECKCHHCQSGASLFVAKWRQNTFLFILGLVVLVVVVLLVLVVVGTCVRGCVEQRRGPHLLPTKSSSYDLDHSKRKRSAEDVSSTGNHYTTPKPPVPPNKPKWPAAALAFKYDNEARPSLSESAKGHSTDHSDSDGDNDNEAQSVTIELHRSKSQEPTDA